MAYEKGKTPIKTIEQAREYCQGYFEQGCDHTLYIFKSIDPQYEEGFTIESENPPKGYQQRRIEYVETIELPKDVKVIKPPPPPKYGPIPTVPPIVPYIPRSSFEDTV